MRKLLLVAAVAAITIPLIIAQAPQGGGRGGGKGGGRGKGAPAPPPPPPPAGLECFDTLATPEFPRAALQEKVDGTVWVNFEVTPEGAVDKIETQVTSAYADGPKLLTPPAEAAVKAAKMKSDCDGKKVLVVFRYELHGEPVANPQVTSRREPSYIVWIESQPMTRGAAGAGKAAKK
jgi:hypothetical protein